MLIAFLYLIGCQLIGELVREVTGLPIPGPVIGMFLLAAMLVIGGGKDSDPVPCDLERTAGTLIHLMGLLFVPAGVGIIAEAPLLREEWLPILAALLGSTVLSIAVTGAVMHWTVRLSGMSKSSVGIVKALGRTYHE
jgi:holin-like protein